MTLTCIGIGLSDELDITVKGWEAVKDADVVYLECYTSILQVKIEKLEEFYNKKIIKATRDLVENKAEQTILKDAKTKKVVFLIVGDIFGATTHVDLVQRAKEKNIEVKYIHNASILTAVGETGLELYKFGKVTSIPFENKNVETPIEVFKNNCKNELHTLFLLDLDPVKNRFMSVKDAIEYLIKNNINKNLKAIAC